MNGDWIGMAGLAARLIALAKPKTAKDIDRDWGAMRMVRICVGWCRDSFILIRQTRRSAVTECAYISID